MDDWGAPKFLDSLSVVSWAWGQMSQRPKTRGGPRQHGAVQEGGHEDSRRRLFLQFVSWVVLTISCEDFWFFFRSSPEHLEPSWSAVWWLWWRRLRWVSDIWKKRRRPSQLKENYTKPAMSDFFIKQKNGRKPLQSYNFIVTTLYLS